MKVGWLRNCGTNTSVPFSWVDPSGDRKGSKDYRLVLTASATLLALATTTTLPAGGVVCTHIVGDRIGSLPNEIWFASTVALVTLSCASTLWTLLWHENTLSVISTYSNKERTPTFNRRLPRHLWLKLVLAKHGQQTSCFIETTCWLAVLMTCSLPYRPTVLM